MDKRIINMVAAVLLVGAVRLCAQSSIAGTADPARQSDILKFRNGDILHGVMADVGPETGIEWRHPDVKDLIRFGLVNVADVTLQPRISRLQRASHRIVVELTNGDRLLGDIEKSDEKVLVLKTWYAGELSIKRQMVQRITPVGARAEMVYVGPTSLEGWTVGGNPGAWIYKKGALYSANYGSIGRDVKLPDLATLDFDITWRGQFSLQASIYTEDLRQMRGGYMLQFNSGCVYLQRGQPDSGYNSLGSSVEVPELLNKSRSHITVKINKPRKTVTLFVNGRMVQQWTDPGDFAGRGTGLMFSAQGRNQSRVSNIRVAEWDGKLDSDSASPVATAEDLIMLTNGDKVSGTLESVVNGEIAFSTSYAPLKIPLDRVLSIVMSNQKSEKPRRQASDVRAYFDETNRLTLALEKIDEKTVGGTSENCGKINAGLEAFSRIQFNIYQPLIETATDDDWDLATDGAVTGRGINQ